MTQTHLTDYFVHQLLRAHDWQQRPQLNDVCQWWRDGGRGVLALVGMGGAGKTAIVERFLRVLPGGLPADPVVPKDSSLPKPRGVFVFSFYDAPNPEAFFEALQMWLDDSAEVEKVLSLQQLLFKLQRASGLLVLDGLEKVQEDGVRGILGRLASQNLREFLDRVAAGYLPDLSVLVTSRFPLADLRDAQPQFFRLLSIDEIELAAGICLLRARGVRGTEPQLVHIVNACGRHALTVDFTGGYIAEFGGGDPATPVDFEMDSAGLRQQLDDEPDEARRHVLKQGHRFARLAERYRDAMLGNTSEGKDGDAAALALLERICLFRLGVAAETLSDIFTGKQAVKVSGPALASLSAQQLQKKLDWLVRMRIVDSQPEFRDVKTQISNSKSQLRYSIHPAVRDGFLSGLGDAALRENHEAVRRGLEVSLGDSPGLDMNPSDASTLDLLEEIIHHTLNAKRTLYAWEIYKNRLGGCRNIIARLNDYSRAIRITKSVLNKAESDPLPVHETIVLLNDFAYSQLQIGCVSEARKILAVGFNLCQLRNDANLKTLGRNLATAHKLLGHLVPAIETWRVLVSHARTPKLQLEAIAEIVEIGLLRGCNNRTIREADMCNSDLPGFTEFVRDHLPVTIESPLISCNQRQTVFREYIGAIEKDYPNGHYELASMLLKCADCDVENAELESAEALMVRARNWAVAHDAKEVLCWAGLVQARIKLAKLRRHSTGENRENGGSPAALNISFASSCSNALRDGLQIARDCGYSLYHIDLLLARARLHLLSGEPQAALDDLHTALDVGISADEQTGQPELLAATHAGCGYAWAIAEGLQLRAEALLLQAAQMLGESNFALDRRDELPAAVRDLLTQAESCLTESLDRWQPLHDPRPERPDQNFILDNQPYNHRAAETHRVIVDLNNGVLCRALPASLSPISTLQLPSTKFLASDSSTSGGLKPPLGVIRARERDLEEKRQQKLASTQFDRAKELGDVWHPLEHFTRESYHQQTGLDPNFDAFPSTQAPRGYWLAKADLVVTIARFIADDPDWYRILKSLDHGDEWKQTAIEILEAGVVGKRVDIAEWLSVLATRGDAKSHDWPGNHVNMWLAWRIREEMKLADHQRIFAAEPGNANAIAAPRVPDASGIPNTYDGLATELLGYLPPLALPKWNRDPVHNIGGLTDYDEQRLAAIVCSRTEGMTAERWAKLGADERIAWMHEAAMSRRTNAIGDTTVKPGTNAVNSFDVFLSHNGKNKSAVRDLKQQLLRYSLTVWFDEDELQPGIPWQKLLEDGIHQSSSIAVLIGKDGLGPWEDEEMQTALRLAVADKRPVIPVLMPGAAAQPKLPMFLTNRTWVDLRNGFTTDGLNKLVWGITGNKPSQHAAPKTIAAIEFTLDRPLSEFNEAAFRSAFQQATGIDASLVRIASIRSGSTIVRMEASPDVIEEAVRQFQSAKEKLHEFSQLTGLRVMRWTIGGTEYELKVEAFEAGIQTPRLLAKFQEENGQPLEVYDGEYDGCPAYWIDLWIDGAPAETTKVTFEVLDDEERDEPSWTVKRSKSASKDFLTDDFTSYGDVEIIAVGSANGNRNLWEIKSSLLDALIRCYGTNIPNNSGYRRAIDQLRTESNLPPSLTKNVPTIQSGNSIADEVPTMTARQTSTENAMPSPTGNEPAVVLITVNDHETDALLDVFLGPRQTPVSASRGGVTYHELGVHGGLRVIHSLCEMGAGGIGAAQQRAQDAITHWQPRAVIAVGIAFGMDENKQQIGDVLVSVQLQDYELARLNADGTLTPRGDKAHAADTLVNRFRQTDVRCRRGADEWPKVRFGLVLSGQKLVDNLDYRQSLKRLAPEAIGGEMEGTGLYTSAQRAGADWLVVKAICDWGHNKNQADKDAWQKTAAANAARVVKAALVAGDLYPLAAAELPLSVTATEQPAVRSNGDRNPTTDSAATEPNVLLETLKQLPGPWFEELVFKFDQHNSVPTGAAQTVRAIELLKVLRMTERGFQAAAAEITRLKERSQ
ncbi:MAG: TIR domain-containing protein [Planctomycetaceae bacterium]|nr:TIR domain-containing protein [Planctomycetaceae bacterium]